MPTYAKRSLLFPILLAGLLLAALGGAALAGPICESPGCPPDPLPTISVTTPSMTYNEGSGAITATNTGTYTSGDAPELSASSGTIQQDVPSGGHWTWSAPLNADDGPLTQTVTVSISDSFGAASKSFTVKVNDLPPTATFWAKPVVAPGTPVAFQFSNQTDPSAADRAAGYSYKVKCDDYFRAWDWNYNGFSYGANGSCSTYGANPQHLVGRIYDKDGGFTEYSAWTQHDSTAPSLTMSSPQGGATVHGMVLMSASVSDNIGVDFVRVNYGDNGQYGYTDLTGPGFSVNMNSASYPDGPFTLKAVAYDTVGNSTTQLVTITIDNTPPDTSISGGPTGAVSVTVAAFGFASTEGGNSFEYKLDGGIWTACACTSASFSSLANGSHTFQVRAHDAVGNVDASPASRTWIVETTPPTPTNVAFGAITANSVALSFTDNALAETGFVVQRRIGTSGTWANVALPQPGPAADTGATLGFTDTTVQPGTVDYYRVKAVTGDNSSAWAYAPGPASVALPAPTGFQKGAVTGTSVALAWTDTQSETGYAIERKVGTTGAFTALGGMPLTANATSYTDSTAQPGVLYSYRIRALRTLNGSTVYSAYSTLAAGVATPLDVPTGFQKGAVTAGSVALSWTDTQYETGYVIERRKASEATYTALAGMPLGANATAKVDTSAAASTTYYYRMRAVRTLNGATVYSAYTYLAGGVVTTPAA